jgi:hypothetical protein
MRLLTVRLFQVAAVCIGLPGIIGTLYFGGLTLYARWNNVLSSTLQKGDGSIIDISNQLFVGMFRGMAHVADFFMIALLAVSIFLVLLGAALWIASMALATGKLWGRAVAVVAGCFLVFVIVVIREISKVIS